MFYCFHSQPAHSVASKWYFISRFCGSKAGIGSIDCPCFHETEIQVLPGGLWGESTLKITQPRLLAESVSLCLWDRGVCFFVDCNGQPLVTGGFSLVEACGPFPCHQWCDKSFSVGNLSDSLLFHISLEKIFCF